MDDHLASKRKLIERAQNNWVEFQDRRKQYLAQMHLRNGCSEKITENILIDLFTLVLDWPLANIDYQSGRCDIVLVDTGIKHLLVEAKYPGKFNSSTAMKQALSQVTGYSLKHQVYRVAVSDGYRLYAIDLFEGKICERIDITLDGKFSEELWLVSRHGIYRSIEHRENPTTSNVLSGEILHPKYKLPSKCFAYVGHPLDPKTWSLPYLLSCESVDEKRLPKAISSIVSNYRGSKVSKIPDKHIHDVLRRLEIAARHLGKMPDQNPRTAQTYCQLNEALAQVIKQYS